MILTYRQDRFIAFASYDERHIPKGAGFRWDGASKSWHTVDAEAASRLDSYADDHAWPKLEAYYLSRRAAIEESRSEVAAGDIPAPEGLAYLPYQRAGILYALRIFNSASAAASRMDGKGASPGSGVLIADEPGL